MHATVATVRPTPWPTSMARVEATRKYPQNIAASKGVVKRQAGRSTSVSASPTAQAPAPDPDPATSAGRGVASAGRPGRHRRNGHLQPEPTVRVNIHDQLTAQQGYPLGEGPQTAAQCRRRVRCPLIHRTQAENGGAVVNDVHPDEAIGPDHRDLAPLDLAVPQHVDDTLAQHRRQQGSHLIGPTPRSRDPSAPRRRPRSVSP